MSTIADRLAELAARVVRNEPDRRDPERFHTEKSDIAHQLRRIAKETQHGGQ
jgi:hypothetical protein